MNLEQTFARYSVLRKLGQSMSAVYLAKEIETDRLVVLKVLEDRGDDLSRLALEAERRGTSIQQRLRRRDTRILEILESGERSGCFFVVMEYFPGRTLAEIVESEGKLEPRRAALFAAESCSQLRTLHEFVSEEDGAKTPVVHGDIKPSNIQINDGEQLRLLDFGIAKVITSGHDLTHHDLGSPSYCSPERLRKSEVDIHADLWALGVSLYEMLAGEPPFQAKDTRQLEDLIQARRPPRTLPETCPADLRAVVSKALAGNLQRRYASAEKLEADLRTFLDGRPTEAMRERDASRGNSTVDRSVRPEASAAIVPPETSPRAPKTLHEAGQPARQAVKARATSFNLAVALLAGLLAGLALFLPAMYFFKLREDSHALREPKDYASLPSSALAADWQTYQRTKNRNLLVRKLFAFDQSQASFRANLVNSAEEMLGGFRASTDDQVAHFDWFQARLCLLHALRIHGPDSKAQGELHLCDGYLNLERNNGQSKLSASVKDFQRAAELLPRSPDPHLALARVYAHELRNIGAAMAEYRRAEELGYRLRPREMEQQADGFLYRAEWELNRAKRMPAASKPDALRLSRAGLADIERARGLYDSIAGLRRVNAKLEQVSADRIEQVRWETEVSKPVTRPALPVAQKNRKAASKHRATPAKAHYSKRTATRRWR